MHGGAGSVQGDYWVSNVGTNGKDAVWKGKYDGTDPRNSGNVSVFDP